MLFFLKYAKAEDLQLTHEEFDRSNPTLHPVVKSYLEWAREAYSPGNELVQLADEGSLEDKGTVAKVLEELRIPNKGCNRCDALLTFREIFYQWAHVMRNKFNLLALPHHTQVVCLLAFQRFCETDDPKAPRTLIAQVGTGEGKSMIVAALAIYAATVLKKKAHVVCDDETLLERDFVTFKQLFDMIQVPGPDGRKQPLVSVLCVPEDRLSKSKEIFYRPRVDANADICYCEAKHVQSHYASIAKNETSVDFSDYDNFVLILDEVDALVIDEEPNEAFVYPNEELSKLATETAQALAHGGSLGLRT